MRLEPRGAVTALRFAAFTGAVLMVFAGAAQAQVCETAAGTATTCRMILTRPQAFTVRATWKPPPRSPSVTTLSLTVNGRPCASGRSGGWFGGAKACRLLLPSGPTVIEVSTDEPGRMYVQVTPDNRLAQLPREAKDLDPRKSLLAWLFWP